MRDSQRSKVYDWERAMPWWDDYAHGTSRPTYMTLAECRKMIKAMLGRYRCQMVQVKVARGKGSNAGAKVIRLSEQHHKKSVVIHETAHTICVQRHMGDFHGPVFMRVYIELLATYIPTDKAGLLKSARGFGGLKVAAWKETKGAVL